MDFEYETDDFSGQFPAVFWAKKRASLQKSERRPEELDYWSAFEFSFQHFDFTFEVLVRINLLLHG